MHNSGKISYSQNSSNYALKHHEISVKSIILKKIKKKLRKMQFFLKKICKVIVNIII